jgi:AraC-like DNA-binding protein
VCQGPGFKPGDQRFQDSEPWLKIRFGTIIASTEQLEGLDLKTRMALTHFMPVTEHVRAWDCRCALPRHRHRNAYAALVLAGGYEESGSLGRHRVQAGDVLLHGRFDTHLDRFGPRGARILNLLLSRDPSIPVGRIIDPDAIARLAEKDAIAAANALREQLRPVQSVSADWPDLLARDLFENPQLRLGDWAQRHGLAAETVSRGFKQVFSASPAVFRSEARTRRALGLITNGHSSLAAVAAITGFADQAHMTRGVTALTGRPPGYWLRSNWFKTA